MDDRYVTESLFEWVVGSIVLVWVAVTGTLYAMLNSRSRITRKEVVEMLGATEQRLDKRLDEQRDTLGQLRTELQTMDTKLSAGHDRILSILLERGG